MGIYSAGRILGASIMISEPINVPSGKAYTVLVTGGNAVLKKILFPAQFVHVADLVDGISFSGLTSQAEVLFVESSGPVTMTVQID